MNDRVKVLLRGGLGNQLFQYAAGYALSQRLGVELHLSRALLPRVESHSGHVSVWPDQISTFEHFGHFDDEPPSSNYMHFMSTRKHQLFRTLGDRFPKTLLNVGLFSNESLAREDLFHTIKKPVTIDSYCASPSYSAGVLDEVIRSVEKVVDPSNWFISSHEYVRAEKPIGVHIRLGDFERLAHVYGAPRVEYASRAVKLLKAQFPESPIWLFSDDPAKARDLFRTSPYIDHVVESAPEAKPIESLLLLSACAGIVATNSTFSWWAGAIGHRNSETVIFPRPLYPATGMPEPKRFLLDPWLQVGGN